MPQLLHPPASATGEAAEMQPVAAHSPVAPPHVETGAYCAYNHTRERFLAADVEAADFSAGVLAQHLTMLAPVSGAGIWIIPFRGIAATSVRFPIDLVCLSPDYLVIDAVESFPLAHLSHSNSPAASVLALPAHTISATGTRLGDQLILCAPDEMMRRLNPLESSRTGADNTATASETPPAPAELPSQPAEKAAIPRKNWFLRLFSNNPRDQRGAPREALSGLVAYFFTGGVSEPNLIRDISATGLYLFTQERWYLGTIVRITITDRRQPTAERSLTVNTRVVRWGNDGVGLQFIFHGSKDRHRAQVPPSEELADGITRAQIELFLNRLKSS